jgi:hypothetical protein
MAEDRPGLQLHLVNFPADALDPRVESQRGRIRAQTATEPDREPIISLDDPPYLLSVSLEARDIRPMNSALTRSMSAA